MRASPLLATLLVVIAASCSKDEGTGPLPLAGSWTYATTNLTSRPDGITCSSTGTLLSITQRGASLTGSFSGGTVVCSTPVGLVEGDVGNGTIVSGLLSDNAVGFDLGGPSWHNAGSLSGATITGTVWIHDFVFENRTYALTGSFSAGRP